jgi:hypothetical protein
VKDWDGKTINLRRMLRKVLFKPGLKGTVNVIEKHYLTLIIDLAQHIVQD